MKKGSTRKRNSAAFDFYRKLKGKVILMTILSVLLFPMTIVASEAAVGLESAQQASITVTDFVVDDEGAPMVGVTIVEEGTTNGVITDVDGRYTITVRSSSSELTVQQQNIVKGKVTDQQGEPLPGVTITIDGTTRGVITDIDGTYSINTSPTDKLIFSFVGMEEQIVEVENQTTIDIILLEKVDELEEVTVVAFAKQKKESVIASVSTVNPEELKVPSSNLTSALAGRIAGIISYQRSGEPGQDNADFFVRGVTTFGTGKSNPLILIDGIELTVNDLARLDPDDIASFSVMKDANATALYGARGANGVILVTTKEGREGKLKISARIENSFSKATKEIELADAVTYMRLNNEAVLTRDPLSPRPYSIEKIENTILGANPMVYPNVDWKKMMLRDVATNPRANLSISGGGNIARYYVSASLSQDNGILKMDKRSNFNNNIDLKKYSVRSNINLNLTKTTEMIVRMHGTYDDYQGPLTGGSGLYEMIMKTSPSLFPPYFEKDEANEFTNHVLFGNHTGGGWLNPYAEMLKGYQHYNTTLLLSQIELHQNLDFLLKGLTARALFNTTRYSHFSLQRQYNPYYYRIGAYDKSTDKYMLQPLNLESGTEYLSYNEGGKNIYSTIYFEGAAQYNQTSKDKRHAVSGLLVFTLRERISGNAGSLQLSLPFRNLGLAGRATYAFDNKYFTEFNFGYNGSERFAQNERFGFFPSMGLGYIVSNEDFFDPWKNIITKLKLKATYGSVGNDQIGSDNDRFFYLSEVNLNDGNRSKYFGTNFAYGKNGVSIRRYEDAAITWERSYKQNYGIELGLIDKFELQVDYFRENRTNILQERASIPSTMGLQATPQSNIGKAQGSGIEVMLDYSQNFTNDMWLSIRGNFTYATARYKLYEEPTYELTPWRRFTGQKLSQNYGYIAERLFVDDEDVRNSPLQMFGEYTAGDIKYKDINMDGVIDSRDIVPIGYPQSPEIIYGTGFSFGYKGIDISAFFQGSARSSFWINPNAITPFIDGASTSNALLQVIADDHWSEANRDIHAFWPRMANKIINNNVQTSTWWMRNGTFLRLKNVELGYTIPNKLTKSMYIEGFRIYVSGTNLFTLSNFKLFDPEMAGNGLGYPVQRVFNVGFNINF